MWIKIFLYFCAIGFFFWWSTDWQKVLLNTDLLKQGHRYLQKMAALLKLNEMRSIIKNGGIFNEWRHFKKEWVKLDIWGKGGPGSAEMVFILTDLVGRKDSLYENLNEITKIFNYCLTLLIWLFQTRPIIKKEISGLAKSCSVNAL